MSKVHAKHITFKNNFTIIFDNTSVFACELMMFSVTITWLNTSVSDTKTGDKLKSLYFCRQVFL